MGHWYQKILSESVTGIKPITIVVDPDHLLAEEKITGIKKSKVEM